MLVPVWVYAPAGGALAQLLQRRGADIGQVVGAWARDDGVPDDGLVRLVRAAVAYTRARDHGPLGRDVDEELLRVPGEQRREVRVQRELDDGVFLLLRAVVVRPAFHPARGIALLVQMHRYMCRAERDLRTPAHSSVLCWRSGSAGP